MALLLLLPLLWLGLAHAITLALQHLAARTDCQQLLPLHPAVLCDSCVHAQRLLHHALAAVI
jgi:hypothetical protein